MTRPVFKSGWFRCCPVLFSFLIASGFAAAQTATPPPPPSDAPPNSLQQPAPENQIRAVRLGNVYGSVKVLSNGDVDFKQAELNMPLVEGMKLATGEDGRAEIEFEDGSVARITPNSSLTLAQLGREADGTTVTGIEADSGLTYYELNGRAGQYTVTFGQDKITPVDDAVFRLDLDSAPAELAVMHGSVHASNDAGLEVDARTDQTLQFDPDNPNEYQLLQNVAANSWDQWNSDRDEALAQLAENAGSGGEDVGNPDNPAWSDLDANGDWYDVPGYGMGWSPSGVGEDWDPYAVGSWGYYSGIGYTWISPYSWGWYPYHCGAWSWFDGFGWLWFPGNCFTGAGYGWYPYGTIWSVPPGYVCPRRPRPIRTRNGPVRNPKHGPVPVPPLIAVNRAPQFATLPSRGGPPRALHLNGQSIKPFQGIRPRQGEGFTSSGRSAYPGSFVRPAYGPYQRSGATPPSNRPGTVYMPAPQQGNGNIRMRVPPAEPLSRPAPIYRAPSAPAYRAPAPVYRAPQAPAYHAPPSPPAYHAPAPAPAIHSAPAPSAHPK